MAWYTVLNNGIHGGIYSKEELLKLKSKLETDDFKEYGITLLEASKLLTLINKKL